MVFSAPSLLVGYPCSLHRRAVGVGEGVAEGVDGVGVELIGVADEVELVVV